MTITQASRDRDRLSSPGLSLPPGTRPNRRVFGRTDLWISVSRAKFDEEADFEVRPAVAPQKPRQISEKRKFRSKIFAENFFSASKNKMSGTVRNAFWQSFGPIRAMFRAVFNPGSRQPRSRSRPILGDSITVFVGSNCLR